jgi:hypothetical protein
MSSLTTERFPYLLAFKILSSINIFADISKLKLLSVRLRFSTASSKLELIYSVIAVISLLIVFNWLRFTASDNSVASARFVIFSPNALIFLSVVIKIVFDKSVDNLPSINNYWYSSIVVFKTDKSE